MTRQMMGENKQITTWLWGFCALILAMIMLGGATRLTHSGLSIVEWKPIAGAIPPLNISDWTEVFDQYKLSPEYLQINNGMTLSQFKFIFLMEYFHRLLGRLLALYLVVPAIYFAARNRLPSPTKRTIIILFIMLSIQGFLGWYMVKSGLKNNPMVSPYRLAIHLLMAFALISVTLREIVRLASLNRRGVFLPQNQPSKKSHIWQIFNLALVTLTLFYGALVAGHKAGLIYNTFPLMGDTFVPSEWNFITPLWKNFFENNTTVQMMHRFFAYIVTASALIGVYKKWIPAIYLCIILGQVILGVFTLLYSVPVVLGTLHQGWATVVFSYAAFTIFKQQQT